MSNRQSQNVNQLVMLTSLVSYSVFVKYTNHFFTVNLKLGQWNQVHVLLPLTYSSIFLTLRLIIYHTFFYHFFNSGFTKSMFNLYFVKIKIPFTFKTA